MTYVLFFHDSLTRMLAFPQAAGGDESHDLFVGMFQLVKSADAVALLDFGRCL